MHKPSIDATRRAKLNQLLDAALDQPKSDRAAWVSALAPEFAGLVPQLRELLSRASEVETNDFLNTLPALSLSEADPGPADAQCEQVGDLVGPYRLIRKLGDGGMGTVWLAERSDGIVNRDVALKLPHGAWKRAGLVERMAREREILAALSHPHIARLYDAGLTAEGQPYLALEYVEGVPLDAYCRDNALDIRSRLDLFTQVASAVAYAHSKLIIHRDLKPANILVTAASQVRLLDFGIAKLLAEGQAQETKLTQLSGRALTLDYASPEQVIGAPLTIASDVYSLGVVLYELLSGARLYKLKRESRGALEDAIVQGEPCAPSVAAADARVVKQLRGDLDTIVLKAIRKNPLERYVTVHALIDDIERYLTSRPVLAQRDSVWYRLNKFVARNTLTVSAASAVVVAIVIGASVVAWQSSIARDEKSRADEVKEFIASVFREADPTRGAGDVLSAAELLRQAEQRLATRPAASRTSLELLTIISESLFGLQQNADAARVANKALAAHSSNENEPALKARLHLVLSRSFEYLGRNDEAREELARADAMLAGIEEDNRQLMIELKLHSAALALASADYESAERLANEALAAARKLYGPRSSQGATALQLSSQAYLFTQRGPLAVESSHRAFELMRELHGDDLTHPLVIDSAMYYSQALAFIGDFDAAADVIRTASDHAVEVFGENNRMVGELFARAVPPELERGAVRYAALTARRSLDIYLQEAKQDTLIHASRARLLGHSLLAARAGDDAVDSLREAVRLSAISDPGRATHLARASFGMALVLAGQVNLGEKELQATLQASAPKTRAHHQAMRHLGTLARLQGRSDEAVRWLEPAIAEASLERTHRNDLASGLVEIGLAKLELGQAATAQSFFVRAQTLYREFQTQHTTPAHADLLVGMARVLMMNKKHADALPLLEKATGFWDDFDKENRSAGEAAYWLGHCQFELGRKAEARVAFQRVETLLAGSTIPADVRWATLARER